MTDTEQSGGPWPLPSLAELSGDQGSAILDRLGDVQAGIVQGRSRDSLRLYRYRITALDEARTALASLDLRSAADELRLRAERSAGREVTRPDVLQVALTLSGTQAFGLDRGPDSMRRRQHYLNDPAEPSDHYKFDEQTGTTCDVMIIAAWDGDHEPDLGQLSGFECVGTEEGSPYRNAAGRAMEHFGYMDGRSQPRFFEYEAVRDRSEKHRVGVGWDSGFSPELVLLANGGSYLVYRKLEQNVKRFKALEHELGETLVREKLADDEEAAGAMIVGRSEEGEPFGWPVSFDPSKPPNDFSYLRANRSETEIGDSCPFAAHVRLVNPRSAETRSMIMARRGMTYGPRTHADGEFTDEPEGGVGLLFLAYMVDIGSQFEAAQRAANGENREGVVDGIIGQVGQLGGRQDWPGGVGSQHPITNVVTLLGGDYFYVPPISEINGIRANLD